MIVKQRCPILVLWSHYDYVQIQCKTGFLILKYKCRGIMTTCLDMYLAI